MEAARALTALEAFYHNAGLERLSHRLEFEVTGYDLSKAIEATATLFKTLVDECHDRHKVKHG